ncbi:hypothetical protein RF11_12852 [Thelohanellus kitauei]|uniref:Peptidase M50 domain-containing protein n=1 Tax=Thelohanellus kitauei TaxID=669202 RepID=A0A0C2IX22_THEKT|nr:hypothetical protein RF11_12852 [Thelohanellus kitauei]
MLAQIVYFLSFFKISNDGINIYSWILQIKEILGIDVTLSSYLVVTCLLIVTEIIHESGHILAAFVDGIEVTAVTHDVYVGFMTFSKTHYKFEDGIHLDFMTLMRFITGGVTQNFTTALLLTWLILSKFTRFQRISKILVLTNITALISNMIPFPGSDGNDLIDLILTHIGILSRKRVTRLLHHIHIMSFVLSATSIFYLLYKCR